MAYDFSGPEPEAVVFETQTDIPKRFIARLIDRAPTDKNPEKCMVWLIDFDGTTHDAAAARARNWWRAERAKHDERVKATTKREADRAAKRNPVKEVVL